MFRVLLIFNLFLFGDMSDTTEIMAYMNTNLFLSDLTSWILLETSSVNRNACLMMCLPTTDCRGILYKTSTQGCILVSYNYMDSIYANAYLIGSHATLPSASEWVFYHVVRDCYHTNCPVSQGYTFIGEICVCLKYNNDQKTYTDAMMQCKLEGGELIKIQKAIKQEYVAYYLDGVDVALTDRIYIQAQKSGGKWLFDNGEELQYYHWAVSQPNNSPGETIIFLHTSGSYNWHDGGSGMYPFLCEISL